MEKLVLDGCSLTLADLVYAARHKEVKILLDEDAVIRMKTSRAVVDRCVSESPFGTVLRQDLESSLMFIYQKKITPFFSEIS